MDEVVLEEKKLRRVSFSQYAMYSTCPHQWKLAYHDKLKPDEGSIHLVFGKALHETIQEWLTQIYSGVAKKHWDIEEYFKDKLKEIFVLDTKTLEDGTKVFPTDKASLSQAYLDGCQILRYLRAHRVKFFPDKGWELLGVELPLEVMVRDNIQFIGYIDVIIKEKRTGRIIIFDLKTSKRGWFYEKKDPKKINQLLLYKRFYSEQFGVSEGSILVEFVILKRQIDEKSQWAQRVSRFEPSHGVISVNRAVASFDEFIQTAFHSDGSTAVENLKPTPSTSNCRFCPFKTRKDLCSEGI